MTRSILVICIGNVCRSPMAACLLSQLLPACEVASAGLAPPVGAPADPSAVRLLAREGLDIASHRARAVNDALVAAADLILVMDSEQRDELERVFPLARGKTHRICESTSTDVPDPYGCSPSMFYIVLELIKQGIASWSARLVEVAPTEGQGEVS
ncbi:MULTISPECIES: low molecular weight protein-tyrosine-phosphatase [unclassified Cupriavidus]|jgi:protein-tyrosine phosphatase|uniref:low molecular weight protein-tyrosine-phosphatase n=1 Tax=unclassified Cupriavidus TaxID=2640874 RepID=UPI00056C85D7|nr:MULTISPECIES: low molecular weight protein-tyrosine-phosphatase [unclassified Cupriavidus]MBP0629222.1 low molecular weight phosphotyrosine protein phosphatase [Cupriavidus sp. AcVe19-1a]MBP0635717.1 low molecular weight phosphotyrosine protein phosphatase [Cupriavidus sp. AcVe19-6a]